MSIAEKRTCVKDVLKVKDAHNRIAMLSVFIRLEVYTGRPSRLKQTGKHKRKRFR